MELILISSSKLKIMLTEEDMLRYELDCSSVNYDNTETRRAFWNILDEVKHRTGFDAASERVFIQLYPSKAGGCEIFVTKVGLPGRTDKKIPGPINCGPTKLLPDGECENMQISFMFESVGQMIEVCRLAGRVGRIYDSSAWVDGSGGCYLFADIGGSGTETDYIRGVMNEFGSPIDNPNHIAYIKEHSKNLCTGRAIETLSVL